MPYVRNSVVCCENSEIAGDLEKTTQDIVPGGLRLAAVGTVDVSACTDVR
jgi:hypothetical protein